MQVRLLTPAAVHASDNPCPPVCPRVRALADGMAHALHGVPARLLAAGIVAMLLTGCASDDTTRSGIFSPYRSDLPQGNYLTQTMLDDVKPGMSSRDVQRALGSPLLTDVFQPDRWNYVFRYRHPNGRVDLRKVIIRFDSNDRVASIDADELPAVESPSDTALPGFRLEAYENNPGPER